MWQMLSINKSDGIQLNTFEKLVKTIVTIFLLYDDYFQYLVFLRNRN